MSKAKTLLTKQPLLTVLHEFIRHMQDPSTHADASLSTRAKRNDLA